MPLTPNAILEQKFSTRFRGYDPDEVDPFLEEVAAALVEAVRENNALKDRLSDCEAQLATLKDKEREFREALTSAHRLAEDMKAQAEREGQLIVERAKIDAERIVADGHQEAIQLEERIRGLRRLQRESVLRTRSGLEHYLRLLEDEELPSEEFEQALEAVASEARALQGPHLPLLGAKSEAEADVSNESVGESRKSEVASKDGKGERPSFGPALDIDAEKIWPTSG